MQLTCPHCHHSVDYSNEPPRFCSYCGSSLTSSTPGGQDQTQDFDPATAPTRGVPPGPGTTEATPETIGGYRLLRRLGSGGMGSVFEAQHIASGQRAAVKLINPEVLSEHAVERFRAEGKLASSIAHPRCVFILAADHEGGHPYIVMELMPGDTLAELVAKRGPLSVQESVSRILDVIDGLREAHRLGVIHRDVKPSNCFIDADNRVKIGDFGLAKHQADDQHPSLTRTGAFVGTVLFSSPEQIKRQPLDQQADVYSVAATLYFLLTGKAPFADVDALAATARIVTEDPPSLRSHRPDIPEALDRVVMRGLAREKESRWSDLDSFRSALQVFVRGHLSEGGLGYRFAGHLIDILILLLILTPLRFAVIEDVDPQTMVSSTSDFLRTALLRGLAVSGLVYILYFGLMEGLLGWTVGKWLFNLRTCRDNGIDAPGLGWSIWRAFVFFNLRFINDWLLLATILILRPTALVVQATSADPTLLAVLSVVQVFGFLLSVAIPLVTMRRSNGFRGTHELLSYTRVVQLPQAEAMPTFAHVNFAQPEFKAPEMPSFVGPYQTVAAWRWLDDEKTLLGEDPALGRQVLIWLRSASEPALKASRRDLGRPTRPRWVASGSDGDTQWDAFLAPRGAPLPQIIDQVGHLKWADALPILEELASELAASCRDGTLPRAVSVHQVWVDDRGRVQLLGGAFYDPDKTKPDADDSETDADRALALLRDTAALTLEGKLRSPSDSSRLRAPVPLFARKELDRLLSATGFHSRMADVHRALRDMRKRPVVVTRQRRLMHLAAITAMGLLAISITWSGFVVAPLYAPIFQIMIMEAQQRQYEAAAARDLALASLQPRADTALVGLAAYSEDQRLIAANAQRIEGVQQYLDARLKWSNPVVRSFLQQQIQFIRFNQGIELPHRSIREASKSKLLEQFNFERMFRSVFMPMLLMVPLAWAAWAFITRGGLTMFASGIAIVRRDGRPAARWQCLLRSLLFWLPLVVLCLAFMELDRAYWSHWTDLERRSRIWMPVVAFILSWCIPALAVAYFARAIWRPERSLHDRLAGTWLVPR